jgi:tetratricopeptide (TPR) repeat protein
MKTSPYKCYYTNLALQQTGRMPDSMYRYDQIGVKGLLPDDGNYYINYMKSEFYYRLGLVNEAHHRTMDALVGGAEINEPALRSIRRLKECAMLHNNTPLADKYETLLDASLFYSGKITKPDINPVSAADMLILDVESLLESILKHDPHHKAAFEYLMSFYMLKRDHDKAMTCYNAYFDGLNYPKIPVHYAEFLTLYHRLNSLGEDFFVRHPVPQHIRDDFEVMELYLHVKINEEIFKNIEKLYGKTYWFYVIFPLIDTTESEHHEKSVY